MPKTTVQHQIEDRHLQLQVKKAPFLIRGTLYVLAFFSVLAPVLGILVAIASGSGPQIGFLFVLALFGALGFYMLRLALWNTYGKEEIKFGPSRLEYVADYGWFKSKTQYLDIDDTFKLLVIPIGYEDEGKGVLQLKTANQTINCAVKMNVMELDGIINEIETIIKIDTL